MKAINLFLSLSFTIFSYNLSAQPDGTLDSTFGINGKVITDISPLSLSDNLEDLLLQPDGKIIAVGWFHTSSPTTNYSDLAIVRYSSDGAIDSSFGLDGKVICDISQNGWHTDFIRSAVLQTDGKIICIGGVDGATSIETFIARFLPNGNIDSLFGSNGIVVNDLISNNPDEGSTITLQSDGKILIGVRDAGVIMRYNQDGTIDNSFGNNGIANINQAVERIALQTDGKILAAGEYNPQSLWWWYFGIVRLDSNGVIDNSFGVNGRSFFDHSNIAGPDFWSTWVNALIVQSDGKIVIGGGCEDMNSSNDTRFAMGRLNIDGSLDTLSFGNNGRVVVDLPGSRERIHDVTLQPDGKIFFIGEADNSDFAIVRVNVDGTLDDSFNGTGIKLIDFIGGWDYGYASSLQTDGKLLIGGPVICNNQCNYDFGLVRLFNTISIGIDDINNDFSNIIFFPNPNSGSFNINLTHQSVLGQTKIEVHSAFGSIVYSQDFTIQSTQFKKNLVLNQPAGIYYVVIRSNNDVWTGKVIVSK